MTDTCRIISYNEVYVKSFFKKNYAKLLETKMNTKKELIEYCLTFPEVYEDYPFDENWAAIRFMKSKKTFAYVFEHLGKICLNLKCEPMRADFYRNTFEAVKPAYHMNKTHWNMIIIGGDVGENDLIEMINHSYDLVKGKK